MRIEQLQAFLAVVDCGSFQAAARQCQLTQSTVSRQVQALETTLKAPLLHRGAKATLTVAGECLLPRARRICQDWQHGCQEVADLMAGKQPELRVAAIQSVCAHILPPVLQKFCQDLPEVQLRVTALGSDRSLKVLRDGLVDIAVVMQNSRLTLQPEMATISLYKETVDVLMAADHPLRHHKRVPWAAMSHFPHVVFKDGYGMQRLVQGQFRHFGVELNAALELNTLDAFRGVVRQGNFLALLPRSALIECHQDNGLAVLPTTEPELVREVVLVTTQDRLLIPPVQYFYELVRTLVPQQINLHQADAMVTIG